MALQAAIYPLDNLLDTGNWVEQGLGSLIGVVLLGLYAYLALRVSASRQNLGYTIRAYFVVQTIAFLMMRFPPSFDMRGFKLYTAGNVILGIFFVQETWRNARELDGLPDADRSVSGRAATFGAALYAGGAVAMALVATAVSVPVMASESTFSSPFYLPFMALAGPQWLIIEAMTLSEDLSSVFFVSVLYYPFLMLPMGLFLMRRRWLILLIVGQILFVCAHLLFSYAFMVGAALSL